MPTQPDPTPDRTPDSTPAHYIHGHHESVLRTHAWRTVENSAQYLVPHLGEGLSLLDVGCGPATITIDLAHRLAPGRVVGLDASSDVVDLARASGADVANVEFVVGDAYALPFADAEFDIVHAHQVLQHLADPIGALREFARVTRVGGIVAARDVDYAGAVWYPESTGLTRWMALYQAVARASRGEPDAGRRLLSWARAAGFERIEPTASIWSFADDADRRWWGTSWATRSIESEFAKSALRLGLATETELVAISEAWLDWADDPDATLLIPHGEIVCHVD